MIPKNRRKLFGVTNEMIKFDKYELAKSIIAERLKQSLDLDLMNSHTVNADKNTYDNLGSVALSEEAFNDMYRNLNGEEALLEHVMNVKRNREKSTGIALPIVSICCEAEVKSEKYFNDKQYYVCTSCGKAFCGTKQKLPENVEKKLEEERESSFSWTVSPQNLVDASTLAVGSVPIGMAHSFQPTIMKNGLQIDFQAFPDPNSGTIFIKARSRIGSIKAEYRLGTSMMGENALIREIQEELISNIMYQYGKLQADNIAATEKPKKNPFWKKVKTDPFQPF